MDGIYLTMTARHGIKPIGMALDDVLVVIRMLSMGIFIRIRNSSIHTHKNMSLLMVGKKAIPTRATSRWWWRLSRRSIRQVSRNDDHHGPSGDRPRHRA
jgi:hypothetical protein